jgi:hypothetical protein
MGKMEDKEMVVKEVEILVMNFYEIIQIKQFPSLHV